MQNSFENTTATLSVETVILLEESGTIKCISGGDNPEGFTITQNKAGTNAFQDPEIPISKEDAVNLKPGEEKTKEVDHSGNHFRLRLSKAPFGAPDILACVSKSSEQHTSNQIQFEILDHLADGIITFDRSLKIHPVYSKVTEKILEATKKEIVGSDVLGMIFKENLDDQKLRRLEFDLKTVFGGDDLQWFCTASGFPSKIQWKNSEAPTFYKTDFHPIFDNDGKLEKIMLNLEDISRLEKITAEADSKQQDLKKLSSLLAIEDGVYEAFIEETEKIFEACRSALRLLDGNKGINDSHTIDLLFRNIHTLKGSAGLFNLTTIQNVAHDVESFFANLKQDKITISPSIHKAIGGKLDYLESEVESYEELRRRIISSSGPKNVQKFSTSYLHWIISLLNRLIQGLHKPELNIRDIDCMHHELQGALASVGKVSLRFYMDRFDALVARVAETHGKKMFPLKIYSSINYFEKNQISRIADIIIHCLSNAVAHGIELPIERTGLGKPEEGRVKLRISERQNSLRITIEDDGKGIDPEKISHLALAKGLITQSELNHLQDKEKQNLILLPGFTSKATAGIFSGRGVGMGAINDMTSELGGRFSIDSKKGNGTTVTIDLPHSPISFIHNGNLFDIFESTKKYFGEKVKATGPSSHIIFKNRLLMNRILQDIQDLFILAKAEIDESTATVFPTPGHRYAEQFEIQFNFLGTPFSESVLESDENLQSKYETIQTLTTDLDVSFNFRDGGSKLNICIPSGLPHSFFDFRVSITALSQSLAKACEYFATSFYETFDTTITPLSIEDLKREEESILAIRLILCPDSIDPDQFKYILDRNDTSIVVFSQNPDLSTISIPPQIHKTIITKLPLSKAGAKQLMELALINRLVNVVKSQKSVNSARKVAV